MKQENETTAEFIARVAGQSVAANFNGTSIIMRDGSRVIPSDHGIIGARRVRERRNAAGRCTRVEYVYADGSRLAFRWSDADGTRITTTRAKGDA